jgi:hypothetical protein
MAGWVKLTSRLRIREVEGRDRPGVVAGWILEHRLEDGTWCAGSVPRFPRRSARKGGSDLGWDSSFGSLATGDLTLRSGIHSSSIRCHTHPDVHGYVRNGRWLPA